jgi:ABC-type multidrug transport system ATPase subunit
VARPHEEAATTRLPAGDRAADIASAADVALAADAPPAARQPPPRARELQAHQLGLVSDGRRLLDDVSFTATRGTLTAVVGPSSAALSALVGMVGGAVQPSFGQVMLDGHDVHAEYMRRYIGMVPLGELIHAQLTVEQALRYAAELRLPPGTSADERRRAVNEVLGELGLTSQRTVQVGKLSDEQRRRATVAMELLTRPPVLVLDEPTAGLEPALQQQMMATLRRLADSGQIVVLATTSSSHLNVCDQVVLLTSAGTTAFARPPDEIDAAMGTSDWSRILEWVSTDPDGAHQAYLESQPAATAAPQPAAPLGRPAHLSLGRQIAVAARRQAWLLFGDQRYAIFLTILPLFFGALALVAPGDTGLGPADPYGNGPDEPVEILMVLDIAAVCMGTALTIRDLISERNVFRREQYLGLSTSAYLIAKILVCGAVVAAQTAFLTIIVMLGKGAPTRGAVVLGSAPFELYVTVAATAIVSVVVGLALSALARYKQLILPTGLLVILLSLMFAGALFPLADKDGVQQVSWLFPSRWGFAASASTVDLHSIAPLADYDALWAHSAGRWLFDMAMLLVLAAAATSVLWWQLRPPARPKKAEPVL